MVSEFNEALEVFIGTPSLDKSDEHFQSNPGMDTTSRCEDIGKATLTAEFKAITLMRYIRKALVDGTFVLGT